MTARPGGASADGPTVVAVDCGASSIRVCRVDLGSRPPQLTVVHRYHHQPVGGDDGHLRWDWDRLVGEVEAGLAASLDRGPVASIGVDTWGVDYGLIDADGGLVAPPFSYRDHRTDGYLATVEQLGAERLYATTGIQLLPLNTLFQLAVHDRRELERARHVLMLPELLVHRLTGVVTAERTSAGTTGLVDLTTGDWSDELLGAIGVDRRLLPPIDRATTRVGAWRGVPVHLVGGHDTASAVVAMAAAPAADAAFVSFGTWMLVGREQPLPEVGDGARKANFSNETGALGGIRLLKNLAGMWLLEGCRSAWDDPPADRLLADAAAIPPESARTVDVIDVTDPRFLHPADMLGEVTAAARLDRDAPPALVVRCLVESLADGTAQVLDQLAGASESGPVGEVHVFGGGVRSELYRQCLAARTGLPVIAGPVEATALGNALVQGLALGIYETLAHARAHLAKPLT
jgi:rhamnulokinase